MEWIVIDTVICSSSGITFSTVWCKIKLILWYQSDVFLPPGSIFTPVNTGVILDNKLLPITIYNVTPFNRNFWFIIRSNKECPGKSVKIKSKCPNNNCMLVICPYGLHK
ncbi:anti-adapter protein IraM [Escherichia coli]|uniref:anti-adapter protein IraM n=1 Tax=Escherichia coli TaxID=562 RepID=UPI0009357C68|nr:anti-adapter protein IraM [Escherichia coli]ELO5120388.1 anti-adapter protein IraM [Escherichia coli]ELS7769962.1 anti-adapter protein IraM [Escherichia coli]MCV1687477.1 anti-adapter protein IraM [Escherichia coli]MED8103540.1 anti-adapter protein IraM [Escherichia coli]